MPYKDRKACVLTEHVVEALWSIVLWPALDGQSVHVRSLMVTLTIGKETTQIVQRRDPGLLMEPRILQPGDVDLSTVPVHLRIIL